MYPIGVVEHYYNTPSSYPFVLALLLAWVSLPVLVCSWILLRRHARVLAKALVIFYFVDLMFGTLWLIGTGT
jgi:hypothetical protein